MLCILIASSKPVNLINGISQNNNLLFFSGDVQLRLRNGTQILMKHLQIGDEILTADPESGTLRFEKVQFFLHRDPYLIADFIRVKVESGKFLDLTGQHGIFASENSEVKNFRFKFAENLQIGEFLLIFDGIQLRPDRITNLTIIRRQGIFAPMTVGSTIVVNEIFASCYAKSMDDRLNRHLTEKLLKFWKFIDILMSILNWKKAENAKPALCEDIPWLLKLIGNDAKLLI